MKREKKKIKQKRITFINQVNKLVNEFGDYLKFDDKEFIQVLTEISQKTSDQYKNLKFYAGYPKKKLHTLNSFSHSNESIELFSKNDDSVIIRKGDLIFRDKFKGSDAFRIIPSWDIEMDNPRHYDLLLFLNKKYK